MRGYFLFTTALRRCFSLNLSKRDQKKTGNQQKTRLEASKPPTVFTTVLSNQALYPVIYLIADPVHGLLDRTRSKGHLQRKLQREHGNKNKTKNKDMLLEAACTDSTTCVARCSLRAAFLWLCKPETIEDHVLYHAPVVRRYTSEEISLYSQQLQQQSSAMCCG